MVVPFIYGYSILVDEGETMYFDALQELDIFLKLLIISRLLSQQYIVGIITLFLLLVSYSFLNERN